MCTVVGGVRMCEQGGGGGRVGFARALLRCSRYSHSTETHFHQREDGPAAQTARRRMGKFAGPGCERGCWQ